MSNVSEENIGSGEARQPTEKNLVRIMLYDCGVHVGNIYYSIDLWGIYSLEREAVAKRKIEEFISQLQVGWTGF